MSEPWAGRFVPPASEAAAPFWEASREQRLVLQWCGDCGRAVQFPRTHCPHCGGDQLEWRPSAGLGTIYACSVHHVPGQPALASQVPYVVALVRLEGEALLMTNVIGCPPESVRVGDAVRVAWEALPDGRHLPLFTPA